MKQKEKQRLMDKFKVVSVGGGNYGDGFFDALTHIEKRHDVLVERIKILEHL